MSHRYESPHRPRLPGRCGSHRHNHGGHHRRRPRRYRRRRDISRPAFAGTCAPFRPAFPGQPCPSPLSDYDSEEWDDDPHPSLAPAAEPSAIRRYTVETTIRRPFYKHRVYEAATPEDACRQALQDDDCEGEKLDDETAGEPYVTGVWIGEDAAYKGPSLPIPTNGHASGQHKMQQLDLLLALLKRLAATPVKDTLPCLDVHS